VTSNLRAEGVKGQADAAAKTWSVAGGDEGNDGCVGRRMCRKSFICATDAPTRARSKTLVSRAPELPRLGAHAHHRAHDAGEHRAGAVEAPRRLRAQPAVARLFRREKTTTTFSRVPRGNSNVENLRFETAEGSESVTFFFSIPIQNAFVED
jgi:hypothetical protein